MITKEDIIKKTKEMDDYLIKTRRFLHENPEVSSKEFKTSELLKKEIASIGLEIHPVQGTGFYAILDTGNPGKTVALRTDIDALPIQEQKNNLKQERIVYSKNDGISHMCGHDGHMAVTLAAAKVLVDLKDQLKGKIIFIFEEGEEIGSGIHAMVEALKPLNIDAIYGTHLTSFMDTGTICLDGGPRMAGAVEIDFNVIGKSGHGSRPDLSINPLFAGANILNNITSAWANQLDVGKTVTLGITQFHAGTVNNVIADKAHIGGSLRYFDVSEGLKALDLIKDVAEKVAAAHKCQIEYTKHTRIATIPVVNDANLAAIARDGVAEIFPNSLITDVKWYASESFAHYAKVAPSVFSFVGIRNEDLGSGAEHHNDYFDLDEAALPYSLGATLNFVNKYLND
ncbi:amidohydrolase [Vagococcus silagei]|uniref:Amidohydrolase n=1 Tax=Vagococcus silagei TaxID=2508885 RepID=A0A4S3B2A6_9ENTE|nr:amidohydrolase [Vagococcus silagei]THB60367.1 amidohydrolase [Vagococcus silagei]